MTKLIYIDTETTGLDPKVSAITQLSGVIRNGDAIEEFNFFMRPHPSAVVYKEALEVQGRTEEEVNAFPPDSIAYADFIALLERHCKKYDKQDKFFFIGFNAKFDADFIREWFLRNNDKYFGSWFWNPPIDVMTIAAFALMDRRQEMPNFKLKTVYEMLYPDDTEIKFHDAMDDIKATRRILRDLRIGWVKKEEAVNAPGKN